MSSSPSKQLPATPPPVTPLRHIRNMPSFSISEFSPSKIPDVGPALIWDPNLPMGSVSLVMESWTYRWLGNAKDALGIYKWCGATHYLNYGRLHDLCCDLFGYYRDLRDKIATSEDLPTGNMLLDHDFGGWKKFFRAPIRSNAGLKMKQIRTKSGKLIGELQTPRENLRAYKYDQGNDLYIEEGQEELSFSVSEYTFNALVTVEFSDNIDDDLGLEARYCFYGLRQKVAAKLAQRFDMNEELPFNPWEVFEFKLEEKEDQLGYFDAEKYAEAARLFGMNPHFCEALQDDEFWTLIAIEPLSKLIWEKCFDSHCYADPEEANRES